VTGARSGKAPVADLRLRVPSPGLLGLPWDRPLGEWSPEDVPLRELPVGPSRHLVRFVGTDGRLWALKELPQRVARHEYAMLRVLEARGLPAVHVAGLALQPRHDNAVLVTRYLDRSWQFRRLLMRLPPDRPRHRARLLDAMVSLLVDLHRHGVFWGDCSLANTLFSRDGQLLQAWLVDAETAEVHAELSPGQRRYDLDILVENVAGGMIDLAVMLDRPPDIYDRLVEEATSAYGRYDALWDALHDEPVFRFADRFEVEGRIRRLHDLGFAVDEISLEPTEDGDERLRLKVAVAGRRYHADELRELTGLDVGEGQARILLGDLRAYEATLREFQAGVAQAASELQRRAPREVTPSQAARRWRDKVFTPGSEQAFDAVGRVGDPVQAYCDLLEVRWLLSEQAGRDVGNAAALEALAGRALPPDSAAMVVVAEEPTQELPALTPEVLRGLAAEPSARR
jgi:hypothetical protein